MRWLQFSEALQLADYLLAPVDQKSPVFSEIQQGPVNECFFQFLVVNFSQELFGVFVALIAIDTTREQCGRFLSFRSSQWRSRGVPTLRNFRTVYQGDLEMPSGS